MDITTEQLSEGLKCIRLAGRLDMKNALDIDMRFTSLTATDSGKIIVDLNSVDFIASIGMRLLISCAKANAARGGQMVLANLQPLVRETLETAGLDSLIPFYADEASAVAALQG